MGNCIKRKSQSISELIHDSIEKDEITTLTNSPPMKIKENLITNLKEDLENNFTLDRGNYNSDIVKKEISPLETNKKLLNQELTSKFQMNEKINMNKNERNFDNEIIYDLICKINGNDAYVIGSWDDWKGRLQLTKPETSNFFKIQLKLKKGIYLCKFIVDENWCIDNFLSKKEDGFGGFNNYFEL